MKTTIRIIHQDDPSYPQVLELRHQILLDHVEASQYEALCQKYDALDYDNVAIVCEENNGGSVIGCIMLQPYSCGDKQLIPGFKLRQMAVSPSYQGKQIGTRLLEFAERIALEKGVTKFLVHSRVKSQGFYAKLGFVVCGEEFLENNLPYIPMEKMLVGN